MRIVTTTLCYPTPVQPDRGIFVQRRAEGLALQDDVELDVVAPQPWCPILRKTAFAADQFEPLKASYPSMLSVPVLGWATDGLAYARSLARSIRTAQARGRSYDLIDAHFEYPDGVGAWLAGRRLGIPVAVTVRGKIVSLSRKAIRRMQIAAMLRGVDARIAVSASLAGWVHRIAGSDLDVHVIPNGVDARLFRLLDRADARRELTWSGQARYVLAVGHRQYVKGFDRLLAIVPAVRKILGDVRFVFVGSDRGERWYRRAIERSIRQSAHADPVAVQLVPPVSPARLNVLYNAADVLVSPSRSEGWCNAITESLAAGTPVVATDVGGNAEQVCSTELGLLVPDGDTAALAGAIVSALSREWNRVLISAHGGARNWEQVAAETQRVFRSLISRVRENNLHASGGRSMSMPAGTGVMP